MIKLTWGQVRQPAFNQALQHLVHTRMSFPVARRLQKITTAIQSEQAEADKMFELLRDKYLVAYGDVSAGTFRIKEGLSADEQADAEKQVLDFQETPIEINVSGLTENEIPLAELTAAELIQLGPILGE